MFVACLVTLYPLLYTRVREIRQKSCALIANGVSKSIKLWLKPMVRLWNVCNLFTPVYWQVAVIVAVAGIHQMSYIYNKVSTLYTLHHQVIGEEREQAIKQANTPES